MPLPSNVEQEYKKLVQVSAIKENSNVLSHLKWQKAINDLSLSQGLLKLSTENKLKEALGYTSDKTFFDWVIVSSYYSIFHSTNALLGLKKTKINSRLHYATLIAFAKHFILTKELEDELFLIYEDAEKKASELLEIIEEEKQKRGDFQYYRLSKNNLNPAKESVANATIFLNVVNMVLKKHKII